MVWHQDSVWKSMRNTCQRFCFVFFNSEQIPEKICFFFLNDNTPIDSTVKRFSKKVFAENV